MESAINTHLFKVILRKISKQLQMQHTV